MNYNRIARFSILLENARMSGDVRNAMRCRRALRSLGAL